MKKRIGVIPSNINFYFGKKEPNISYDNKELPDAFYEWVEENEKHSKK